MALNVYFLATTSESVHLYPILVSITRGVPKDDDGLGWYTVVVIRCMTPLNHGLSTRNNAFHYEAPTTAETGPSTAQPRAIKCRTVPRHRVPKQCHDHTHTHTQTHASGCWDSGVLLGCVFSFRLSYPLKCVFQPIKGDTKNPFSLSQSVQYTRR